MAKTSTPQTTSAPQEADMQKVTYYAKTDLHMGGKRIPAGEVVAVLHVPAHVDPQRAVRGIASGKLDPNPPAPAPGSAPGSSAPAAKTGAEQSSDRSDESPDTNR